MILQQVVNGLSIGAVYGLASVGYALVYSVLGFSNFAHGEFTMIGAFSAFLALTTLHLPPVVGFLAGAAASAAIAVLVEVLVYRPLRRRNSPSLYLFVSALGASIVIQNLGLLYFGASFRAFPRVFGQTTIRLGSISLEVMDVAVFMLCVVAAVSLELVLGFTRVGRSIRATSYDRDTAALMGISVNKVCTSVFMMAGLLAGFSGALRGVQYSIYPAMGTIIIKAWVCAIIGGIGSVSGAFAGGLMLGVIETFVSGYLSSSYRDVFTFIVLVAVLIGRPRGLLGRIVEEKS